MLLYQHGLIALDEKISSPTLLGPEFGRNGKENITVLNLLLHNSGLHLSSYFYHLHHNLIFFGLSVFLFSSIPRSHLSLYLSANLLAHTLLLTLSLRSSLCRVSARPLPVLLEHWVWLSRHIELLSWWGLYLPAENLWWYIYIYVCVCVCVFLRKPLPCVLL